MILATTKTPCGDRLSLAKRDEIEAVLRLAEHLPATEQTLIRGVYERGLKLAEVARLAGCSPAAVSKRLQRAMARIALPEFRLVIAEQSQWTEIRREIGMAVVVGGQSQREVARRLGLSLHRVRQELARIRALCERGGVPAECRRIGNRKHLLALAIE